MRQGADVASKTVKLEARLIGEQKALLEHEVLTLSRHDRQVFVNALLKPGSPNKRLRLAARQYKRISGL